MRRFEGSCFTRRLFLTVVVSALFLVPVRSEGDHLHLRRNNVLNNQYYRELQSGEEDFIEDCVSEFMGEAVLEDGIVSQVEFTRAIVKFCSFPGHSCQFGEDVEFPNLPLALQVQFAKSVCEPFPNPEACLSQVNSMLKNGGGEFGVDVQGQSINELETNVEEWCSAIYGILVDATEALSPTSSPTLAPTSDPTASSPTLAPTSDPTAAPSTQTSAGGPVRDTSSSSISGGAIAGIAIGSAAFIIIAIFLVRRRRQKQDTRELAPALAEVKSDESIFTEDSGQIFVNDTAVPADTTFSSENSAQFAQFTPAAAAASIALQRKDSKDDLEEHKETSLARRQKKADDLDRAIDMGDWEAVYRISSALSDKSETSSIRSHSTNSSRKLLSQEDQKKAARLEDLIDKGDWDAVAAAAQTFSSISSAGNSLSSLSIHGSETSAEARIGASPKDATESRFDEAAAKFAESRQTEDAAAIAAAAASPPNKGSSRRSFMDLITGVGSSSSAAAAAISSGNDNEEGIIGASPRGSGEGAEADGQGAIVAAGASGEGKKKQRSNRKSWRNMFRKRDSEDHMIDTAIDEPDSGLGAVLSSSNHEETLRSNVEGERETRSLASGASTPIDKEMTEKFERMIAQDDWKGLAELAGEEVGDDLDEFGKSGHYDDVALRPTPEKKQRELPLMKKFPSMHGAKVLIPFWEKLIDEVEAEKKAAQGDGTEQGASNVRVRGQSAAPDAVPVSAPSSPDRAPKPSSPPRAEPPLASHTQETYDAAEAFAKAYKALKSAEDTEGSQTIAASEWAMKQGEREDLIPKSED